MRNPALLRISAALTLLGLAAMLACILHFTPRTVALFLGPGLLCGGGGIVLFVLHVIADLRSRRVL